MIRRIIITLMVVQLVGCVTVKPAEITRPEKVRQLAISSDLIEMLSVKSERRNQTMSRYRYMIEVKPEWLSPYLPGMLAEHQMHIARENQHKTMSGSAGINVFLRLFITTLEDEVTGVVSASYPDREIRLSRVYGKVGPLSSTLTMTRNIDVTWTAEEKPAADYSQEEVSENARR